MLAYILTAVYNYVPFRLFLELLMVNSIQRKESATFWYITKINKLGDHKSPFANMLARRLI